MIFAVSSRKITAAAPKPCCFIQHFGTVRHHKFVIACHFPITTYRKCNISDYMNGIKRSAFVGCLFNTLIIYLPRIHCPFKPISLSMAPGGIQRMVTEGQLFSDSLRVCILEKRKHKNLIIPENAALIHLPRKPTRPNPDTVGMVRANT